VQTSSHSTVSLGTSSSPNEKEAKNNAIKLARADGVKSLLKMYGDLFGLGLNTDNSSRRHHQSAIVPPVRTINHVDRTITPGLPQTTTTTPRRRPPTDSKDSLPVVQTPTSVRSFVDNNLNMDDLDAFEVLDEDLASM
jgi:hypothetical protein